MIVDFKPYQVRPAVLAYDETSESVSSLQLSITLYIGISKPQNSNRKQFRFGSFFKKMIEHRKISV